MIPLRQIYLGLAKTDFKNNINNIKLRFLLVQQIQDNMTNLNYYKPGY